MVAGPGAWGLPAQFPAPFRDAAQPPHSDYPAKCPKSFQLSIAGSP